MSARLLWALLMPVLTQLSRLPWIAGMMLGNAISGVSVGLTALLEEFAVGKPCLQSPIIPCRSACAAP